MDITICVASWFKRFTDGKEEFVIKAASGATALEAAVTAGIPEAEIGFITVNGVKADKQQVLSPDDKIKIFPYIIGG